MRTTGGGAAPIHGSKLAAVKKTTPWDGSDAAEEVFDEFSLDDIMGEL